MKYKLIIWDFNGTIIDDLSVGIDSINTLLSRRNMPIISSPEEYYGHFRFPIIDYYRSIGFDFDRESFEALSVEWVAEYKKLIQMAGLREGVYEALEQNRCAGIRQVILSATERKMLLEQLSGLKITDYFETILARSDIYASGKTDIAKAWFDKVHPESALLIGDTEEDFRVAASLGADVILISGGHQSKEKLLKLTRFVFDGIPDAMKYLNS